MALGRDSSRGIERRLGIMQQLDQGALNDAQIASIMQNLDMAPLQQQGMQQDIRGGQLRNQLLEQQVAQGPRNYELDQQSKLIDALGRFGYLGMTNPALAGDAIQQILQRSGLYEPDPMADIKRAAAQRGMSVEQFQQMQQSLMAPPNGQ